MGRRPQNRVETRLGEDPDFVSGGCLHSPCMNSWTGWAPVVGLNGMRSGGCSTREQSTKKAPFTRVPLAGGPPGLALA